MENLRQAINEASVAVQENGMRVQSAQEPCESKKAKEAIELD